MPAPYAIACGVTGRFKNMELIHTLQQRDVLELIEHCQKHYPDITSIVVFGSSTRDGCTPWSDLDVVFNGDVRKFCPPLEMSLDWTFYDHMPRDGSLYKEIKKEGVCVYGSELFEEG